MRRPFVVAVALVVAGCAASDRVEPPRGGRGELAVDCGSSPWSVVQSQHQLDIGAMWGASAHEVWGVSYHGIARYDGQRWTRVAGTESARLTAIWGSSAHDVWAVGVGVMHYDGHAWSSWSALPSGSYHDVWGTGPSDVWVSSATERRTYHFDGSSWTPAPVDGYDLELDGIHGTSASDVWAYQGTAIYHYDGSAWTKWSSYAGRTTLTAIWPFAPDDVYAFGIDNWDSHGQYGYRLLHFDGVGWSVAQDPPGQDWLNVAGASEDGVWLFDDAGQVYRMSHGQFTTEPLHAQHVWEISATKRLATGPGPGGGSYEFESDQYRLYRYDGGAWSVLSDALTTADLSSLWVAGDDDVWAGSTAGELLHYDGSAWTIAAHVAGRVTSLWGSSPTDAWAVGDDTLSHYDGAHWTSQKWSAPIGFVGVWGSAPNDVWAVGNSADILHYDGTSWQKYPYFTPSPRYTGLFGTAANDVWALTGDANEEYTAYHYDGHGWVETKALALTAWGASPGDVWAAGWDYEHWNGSTWTSVAGPEVNALSLWGNSASDVWSVGRHYGMGHGSTAHYDGSSWCEIVPPSTLDIPADSGRSSEELLAVRTTPSGEVWAVGARGLILHIGADAPPPPPPPPPPSGAIVINEVYADSPGADVGTFIELFGPPGQSLDGLRLRLVNGANDAEYAAPGIDLTGRSIGPSGYFVIAEDATVTVPAGVPVLITSRANLQNGPDSVQLVQGSTVVDALAYGSFGTTQIPRGEGAPAAVAPAGRSMSRSPNGADSNDNAHDFTSAIPTPGAAN